MSTGSRRQRVNIPGSVVPAEAFPGKSLQSLRIGDAPFEQVACHLSAAHLGVDHDAPQLVPFPYAELRCDDLHLAADTFPVEQSFHLLTGKIDQYAIVGLDALQQETGQSGLPVGEHALSAVVGQHGVAFQPVVVDEVQRTQESVKERGDVQVCLRIAEVVGTEVIGSNALEHDTRIGEQCRQLRIVCIVEMAVTQLVLRRNLSVDAQQLFHLLGAEGGKLQRQLRRFCFKRGKGSEGDGSPGAVCHGLGTG